MHAGEMEDTEQVWRNVFMASTSSPGKRRSKIESGFERYVPALITTGRAEPAEQPQNWITLQGGAFLRKVVVYGFWGYQFQNHFL